MLALFRAFFFRKHEDQRLFALPGCVKKDTTKITAKDRGSATMIVCIPNGHFCSSHTIVKMLPINIETIPPAFVTPFHSKAQRTAGVIAAPYMV